MTRTIRYELDQDIAVWTLDHPEKSANTIDQEFLDDLSSCIDRLKAETTTRGAVITSAKNLFVAGGDLKDMERNNDAIAREPIATMVEKVFSLSKVLRKLETCGKPVSCAISGTAMGGGFELALACHHRVVADTRGLVVGLPEVQVGLMPAGGGTQRLPRLIGIEAALPLLLEGKSLAPAAALHSKIVDAVASPTDLLATAKRWVREVGQAVQPWDRKDFRIPGGAGAMEPRVAGTFVVSNALVHARTMDNFPAPRAILSSVYEGTLLPIDTALRLEAKYMTKLILDGTARGMVRTLFVSKSKCDKLFRRPLAVAPSNFRRIGIVGAGLMGSGIALVAAQSGVTVTLLDQDLARAEKGKDYARKRLADGVAKGRTTQEKADAALVCIVPTQDYAALRGADLVVEAVFEDRAVKGDVIARVNEVIGDKIVLASNTSSLPISGLAELSKRPRNFIGLHFFSPVDRMPLVEVIRGRKTSDAALAQALDLVQRLRKTPIVVNDARGFFTSRFFGSFVNEGIAMLAEGVSPAMIENAARMLGMPVGPLAVQDEVGLDLAVAVTAQTKKDLGESYQPGTSYPIVEHLSVKLGRQGRKSGGGFYDYPGSGPKTLWSGLKDIWPPSVPQPNVELIKRRMLYVQLIEALKCMQEKVLDDPADGDVGAVLGVGFPAYTGGPFSYIDHLGAEKVLAECKILAKKYGPRFAPPRILQQMVKSGRRFYESTADGVGPQS